MKEAEMFERKASHYRIYIMMMKDTKKSLIDNPLLCT